MFVPQNLLTIILILSSSSSLVADPQKQGIPKQILENWASKFGGPLFEFGRSVTKYQELQGRFQNSISSVNRIELDKLIGTMTNQMGVALREKVEAVRKIMLYAEEKALEYHEKGDYTKLPLTYYHAKKLQMRNDPRELFHVVNLTHNEHFGAAVNTSFSSVHVPTAIYEKKDELLRAIGWTAQMDSTFQSNYNSNPTLSYQYFGSSTGFLRQFPASKWPTDQSMTSKSNPDLYDCRARQWYVGAASSPKNMIILQDVSGSMTGLRREIAKHVVSTILDTLTENDYVNVYSFADECQAVQSCFKDRLVQSNLENIRDLKDGLDQDHTSGVANFSKALHTAFDVLEKYRENPTSSSGCNQAIMVVTDGAPYNYDEIFKERQNPEHLVRVFTYLIGRDVTDKREVMFMACANNGFYTHVSTLSEVQEQVLKYVPVLSRPLVMYQNHSIAWTGVYADVAHTQESDWKWDEENSRRQLVKIGRYFQFLRNPEGVRTKKNQTAETEEDFIEALMHYLELDEEAIALPVSASTLKAKIERIRLPPLEKQRKEFNFLVSLSVPVFDTRNTSKDGKRIASLLGVAGVDIPLTELRRIASPFKLGVNGYAFLTNNNGHVVFHPDHRPVFRDELLKPNYNTVDLSEVELYDGDGTVRNNHSKVMELRQEMIEIDRGYRTLRVRVHQDDFKRVTIRDQKYEYAKLKNTPYTLGLAVPSSLSMFEGQMELYLEKDLDIGHTFFQPKDEERRWTVNPDWSYCEYVKGGPPEGFKTKEDQVLHFLKQIEKAKRGWKWKNTGVGITKRHQSKPKVLDGDIYECDRDLLQSLVFDANVTEVFTEKKLWKINLDDKKFIELNSATMAFLATRSGLTRWIDFEKKKDPTASKIDPFATSALWYKRAVERYEIDPDSFVFSVPFDAGLRNDTKVTAVRAVYVTKNGLQAPVAVVGVQYKHDDWADKFFDITSQCVESTNKQYSHYGENNCNKTCKSSEYNCFVLDDNGFILISENREQTGRFFGEIDGMVMDMLVNSDVYKRVRVTDYQAVCFQPVDRHNFGEMLRGPLRAIFSLLKGIASKLFSLLTTLVCLLLHPTSTLADLSDNYAIIDEGTSDTLHPYLELASINKTRLRPCDKQTNLYTFGSSYNTYNFSYHGLLTKCGHTSGCDGSFNVHFIPHTNLLLVVTDGKCNCGLNSTSIKMRPVEYNRTEGCDNGMMQRLGLYRERPNEGCVKYNANELDMACGKAVTNKPASLLILSVFLFAINYFVF